MLQRKINVDKYSSEINMCGVLKDLIAIVVNSISILCFLYINMFLMNEKLKTVQQEYFL